MMSFKDSILPVNDVGIPEDEWLLACAIAGKEGRGLGWQSGSAYDFENSATTDIWGDISDKSTQCCVIGGLKLEGARIFDGLGFYCGNDAWKQERPVDIDSRVTEAHYQAGYGFAIYSNDNDPVGPWIAVPSCTTCSRNSGRRSSCFGGLNYRCLDESAVVVVRNSEYVEVPKD